MNIEEQITELIDKYRSDIMLATQGINSNNEQYKESATNVAALSSVNIKSELLNLITKEIKQARLDECNRCVKIMYKLLGENYTYATLYGEIKHPDGKTDINKLLQEYTELEPERQKFSDFVEKRLTEQELNKD